MNPLNLTKKLFEPQRHLEILIHGFNLNKDDSPNAELRPLLLEHVDTDVISVDFGPLVPMPCIYPWSIKNTLLVAKCLGQLLNMFINQDIYKPDQIHLIGFSLGAQVAGLSANHLDFKLSKITGNNVEEVV